MPKTTMNKDNGIPLGQYNVRRSGKRTNIEAEAKASCVERLPEAGLRFRVVTPDPRHHPGSRLTIDNIHRTTLSITTDIFALARNHRVDKRHSEKGTECRKSLQ